MMSKQKLTRRIAAGLAASVLMTVSPAFAAESEFQLDQVTVTASRIEESVAKTAKDVTVISKEHMDQKGAKTLADALQGVPGVTVAGYGGQGAKTIAYILGSDRVVVLVDGKRMNLPQGIGFGGAGVDLNTLLIGNNVEKIEVVRGGASALYGADAVGGVINIITKKGVDRQTIVSSGFGSDHAYRNSVTTEGSDQGFAWYISGLSEGSDGHRVNSDSKNRNISVRLDKELSDSEALTFNYDFYDSRAGMPGSIWSESLVDYSEILRRTWSIGYTAKHDAGERLFRYYELENTNKGSWWGNFRHENKVTAFEYQDSAAVNAKHTLTWGGEWRKDEVLSTTEDSKLRKGITTGIYLQDRYTWNDKTTLTTGIRHDSNTIYGDKWLPRVEVSHQQNEATNLFASWGKIFKAPTFDDLYTPVIAGMGGGNPDLKPEQGWTSELGIKKRLNETSEGTLSVFKRRIDGAIKWQNIGDNVNEDWRPINIAGYTATGINASYSKRLSDATTLNLGYTYIDGRDQADQNTGEPHNTFTAGITNTAGKLTTALNGRYIDASGLDDGRVSSRFVADVGFNYAVSKYQSVTLTVNNIFDREYQSVAGYPALGRSVFIGLKQTL